MAVKLIERKPHLFQIHEGTHMGSIRHDKSGRSHHWSDAWWQFASKRLKKLRQKKSLPGQLLLFDAERKAGKKETKREA